MNHLLFKEGGGVSIENLVLHKMKELLLVPPQREYYEVVGWYGKGNIFAVIVWCNILLSINQWHLLHIIKKKLFIVSAEHISGARMYYYTIIKLLR